MEDKWLDDIKKKLSDYEIAAPEGLWEKIDTSLKGNVNGVKPVSRNRIYRYAAIISLLMVLSGFVAYLSLDDKDLDLNAYVDKKASVEMTTETLTNSDGRSPKNHNVSVTVGNIGKVAQIIKKASAIANQQLSEDRSVEDKRPVESYDYNSDTGERENESDNNGDNKEENETRLSLISGSDYATIPSISGGRMKKKQKAYSDKVSIGVMTSAGAYGQNSYYGLWNGNAMSPNPDNRPGNPTNYPNTPDEPLPPVPPDHNNDSNNIDSSPNDPPSTEDSDKDEKKRLPAKDASRSGDEDTASQDREDYSHRIPVKIGVTFLYLFNQRIGIETGLVYTYLSSEVKYASETGATYSPGEQSLHYIGVPLNVKYRPFTWKWFGLYLSGGVELDKCVYGSVRRYSATSPSGEFGANVNRLRERPFQMSANASVGLHVSFNDFIGIYVEPGVSYYFKDGSSLNTIYKERPCNFNINAGIRFSLGHY